MMNGQLLFDHLSAVIKRDKEWLIYRLKKGLPSVVDPARCVEWMQEGSKTQADYRRVSMTVGGREVKFYAHHVFWTLFNRRPIRLGHEIDHACKNPRCVNPQHLEEVSWQENLWRRDDSTKN